MTLLTKRNVSFPSLISDFFGSDNLFTTDTLDRDLFQWSGTLKVPSVNIREQERDFSFELAAPGLSKNDFHVEVDSDGVLTVSAEKQEEKKEQEDHFTRREFSYSSFSRSFRLPENALGDKVDAKYENGILKLTVPKKAASVPKAKKEIQVS